MSQLLWLRLALPLRGGTMRTSAILVVVAFLLAACGTGGSVHVHYVPSPTPHKVVMLR